MARTISRGIRAYACALSLACALCAAPSMAFATAVGDDTVHEPQSGADNVSAGSDVAMYASASQLRVSVPVRVALALTWDGGKFAGPDPRTQASVEGSAASADGPSRSGSGYGIENYSDFKVRVKSIHTTSQIPDPDHPGQTKPSGFGFKTWQWVDDEMVFDRNTDEGYISQLFVRLRADNYNTPIGPLGITDDGITEPTMDIMHRYALTIDAAQRLSDGSIQPGVMGITIEGFNSRVTAPIPAEAVKALHAFDITYTIIPAETS